MIGTALSKLAKENGMKVSDGVAYGLFRGYSACFLEGSGFKLICFTSHKGDSEKMQQLKSLLDDKNTSKEYRFMKVKAVEGSLEIYFNDTVGTMKRINAFIDWFMPVMAQYGISSGDICSQCGTELGGAGKWKKINGVAYHMHEGCAQRLYSQVRQQEEDYREETRDSYATGLVGAVLGGLVGAIPWAIVMYLGYVASIMGLLIGWLADKGYRMLHGRNGKLKVLILILATVIGVAAGTMGSQVAMVAVMIAKGELPGFSYGDIFVLFKDYLLVDDEYISLLMKNMIMGLVYALLGVFVFLYKAYKESKRFMMKELE